MNYTQTKVEQCDNEWPFKCITPDWKAGRNVWREVSGEFYEDMLNCMPPVNLGVLSGAFMVGEAAAHDAQGRVVYTTLVRFKDKHYARDVPRVDFVDAVRGLQGHLIAVGVASCKE